MDREREWGREGGNDESGLKINYCNLGKDPLVYSRGREITSSRDSRISLSLSLLVGGFPRSRRIDLRNNFPRCRESA